MKIYAMAVTIAAVFCFCKWLQYKLRYTALLGYCYDKKVVPTREQMNFYLSSLVIYYLEKALGKKS